MHCRIMADIGIHRGGAVKQERVKAQKDKKKAKKPKAAGETFLNTLFAA